MEKDWKRNQVGLYIHIPFCYSKCSYCSFSSFSGKEELIDSYLDAISVEMKDWDSAKIDSIYIGGGTPNILSIFQMEKLFKNIYKFFQVQDDAEISIEVNPDKVYPDYVAFLKKSGVNRVSLGLQSTNEGLLRILGRQQRKYNFRETFQMFRQAGFDNLNIDLIYGIPGQSEEMWYNELKYVVAILPEHISTYCLSINKNLKLKVKNEKLDDEVQKRMYETALRMLAGAGYTHYEISNFSRPGKECRHNLLYWEGKEYIGLGAGAAGYIGGRRWKNIESIETYIENIFRKKGSVQEKELIDDEKRRLEAIFLGLRLRKGIQVSGDFPFQDMLKLGYLERCKDPDRTLSPRKKQVLTGRGVLRGDRVRIPDQYLFVSDRIILELV